MKYIQVQYRQCATKQNQPWHTTAVAAPTVTVSRDTTTAMAWDETTVSRDTAAVLAWDGMGWDGDGIVLSMKP